MSYFDDPRELAAWLRKDAAKIGNQPGMNGVVARIRIAVQMLDKKEAESDFDETTNCNSVKVESNSPAQQHRAKLKEAENNDH